MTRASRCTARAAAMRRCVGCTDGGFIAASHRLLQPDVFAQGWNCHGLAAAVEGANFIGHAELHAALCAAVAGAVRGRGLGPAGMRFTLALPDDLTGAQQAAVRAALDALSEVPPDVLPGGADDTKAPSVGLAALPSDSLRLVFWHLPSADVTAAALTCAAWAQAGVEDASTRLSVRSPVLVLHTSCGADTQPSPCSARALSCATCTSTPLPRAALARRWRTRGLWRSATYG